MHFPLNWRQKLFQALMADASCFSGSSTTKKIIKLRGFILWSRLCSGLLPIWQFVPVLELQRRYKRSHFAEGFLIQTQQVRIPKSCAQKNEWQVLNQWPWDVTNQQKILTHLVLYIICIWVFFPKIRVVPPNHPIFNRVFPYKPFILGYP